MQRAKVWFKLMSDLHWEATDSPSTPPRRKGDSRTTLVLAGDIQPGTNSVDRVRKLATRFKNVIYILGNHEYYEGSFPDTALDLKAAFEKNTNVLVLENDKAQLQDVRVLGCTLWTDFRRGDPVEMVTAQKRMLDYDQIRLSDGS